MRLVSEFHERGLVEPDGGGLVQSLAVRLEEGLAIGGDGVVHGVPVARELAGHLQHRPPRAHLDRRPLGRPGREQAVLGGDAVVLEDEGLPRTPRRQTAHPVLLPRQPHRDPVDREIGIRGHRALFHLGPAAAAGTADVADHLLDHELDLRAVAGELEDPNVLQAHQGLRISLGSVMTKVLLVCWLTPQA